MISHLIKKRRSIRSYSESEPPGEWIGELIKCARMAPSPSNRQPVRFALIKSQEKKEAIENALDKGKEILLKRVEQKGRSKNLKNWIRTYFRYSRFMFNAPWLFAAGLSNENEGFTSRLSSAGLLKRKRETQDDSLIALGISIDHFMLKALELGLGTCVLTAPLVFLEESDEGPFNYGMETHCFITAGFPTEIPQTPGRKPVSEIFFEV